MAGRNPDESSRKNTKSNAIVLDAERLLPDAVSLIEGIISQKLKSGEIRAGQIIISNAVFSFISKEANENKAMALLAIDEIERIREINRDIVFLGREPGNYELSNATIDSLIYDTAKLAYDEDAVLFTTSKTNAKISNALGAKTFYYNLSSSKKLKIESFFDDATMSVHLKEKTKPIAKKGMPGSWSFVEITKKNITQDEIKDISREIIKEASIRPDSFIEIERPSSTIIQLDKFRIVITKPPFSDGWEITAVRPVKHLSLENYKMSEKLFDRIAKQAEGILIAGSPGMGKSTFAAALAEYYANQEKIIKTVEAPRDLVLPDKITQYAISHADQQEIHDILLLSRPDMTIFDEMRNTDDFKLFADLRLAGIGFIGVVHATEPIDAIQRFVGRIELGVIPQVIDTVIFIKNGDIEKVLSLNMVVKVPSGMTEADLARPVVAVNNFETGKLEYELYSYGEETVVIPVQMNKKSPALELAKRQIESMMSKYSKQLAVEMNSEHKCTVYVPESRIAKIIGKQGRNIADIEKSIGISINIEPLAPKKLADKKQGISFNAKISPKSISLAVPNSYINKNIDIIVNEDYLLTAKVSKKGIIKIKKNSSYGKIITNALNLGDDIKLVLSK